MRSPTRTPPKRKTSASPSTAPPTSTTPRQFVTIRETHSLKDALAGLPQRTVPVPALGLHPSAAAFSVDYGDREETYGPGDAFYMTPGHVPAAEAGTEFVMFSPKAELDATMAAVQAHMQSLQQA